MDSFENHTQKQKIDGFRMSAPKNEKTDGFLFKTHKDNLCLNIWFHFGQTQATHNKECNGLILKNTNN